MNVEFLICCTLGAHEQETQIKTYACPASLFLHRLLSDSLILSLQETRPNITLPYNAGIILSPGYPAKLSFCDKLTILDILAKVAELNGLIEIKYVPCAAGIMI